MCHRTDHNRMDTDELVSRMVQGDDDALRAFAGMFGKLFLGYFARCGLSQRDAEELAVTCVSNIVMRLDKFEDRGKGSFSAWCFAIARNCLVDLRRKRREHLLEQPEEVAADAVEGPEQEDGPNKLDKAVHEGLARLSNADREIIELRHFQPANSFAEIGQILRSSEKAAKGRDFEVQQDVRVLACREEPARLSLVAGGIVIVADRSQNVRNHVDDFRVVVYHEGLVFHWSPPHCWRA